MMTTILTIICSVLAIIIGLWQYFGRKSEFKRKQAEQAKKELDSAIENDSPSDFLDGFGRT